ncbi:amidohydrolase [Sphingomonas sp. HDW15A]|uniref:amidohydrolase n=1 Tax=Sphingomonas sp. HDW15A TaxID=2714942 RepID=UPI00140A694E|nr:amidohydrolase [Sphingomonas sp. HDW15A]QIK96551.1 amidohydrolase [Sphingomonas sp. HDW15A]
MTKAFALAAVLLASAANADTLYNNFNGIQADAGGRIERFDGLLVGDDGKVKRVLHGEKLKLAGDTRVVDLGGRVLMPGLIDAHGHVMGLGYAVIQLDLTGTRSLDELKDRLRKYAAENPGTGWILGRGWNQELWTEKRFPTAADLDSVVSDRPVWLGRVDGHASVGNSAAMRAAGVTLQTKAPDGGEIIDGLFVDNAESLVTRHIPPPDSATQDKALAAAQSAMLRVGLVGAADMGTNKNDWDAMRRAGDSDKLRVRIFSYASGPDGWRGINGSKPTGWMYGDRLRLVGTKLYTDGALGSRGAYLKAPYHDRPDTRGLLFHSDAELLAQATETAQGGGQLAIHAIGDGANAQVIGTYEKIASQFGRTGRWRIEHLQIADPKDLPRLKPAGIVASMQPTHQTSDRLMAEARLGPKRLAGAYAWNTIRKIGVPLAFGSDFPVESPNPFPGLSAAISRQDPNGRPPGGWRPWEKVTLGQAIHGFTVGAAYAGFAEGRMGGLAPGKWADFIIVDRDPGSVDPQKLAKTVVLETWIAGKREFSADAQPAN